MGEESQDHYELLGISHNASAREIKEAFRSLAQKHHPDRGSTSPESVELFKRITDAYRTLADPEARNEYNKEQGYQFHEEVTIGGVGRSPAGGQFRGTDSVEISSVPRDLNALHQMAGGKNDLKVDHKVAQIDEEEMARLEQEEDSDIAAWGDLEAAPVSGGIFSNLLGGRKKGNTTQRRTDLKKNLKRTFKEESIPRRPSHIFDKVSVDQIRKDVDKESERLADPLREERTYRFQITALEAALGTTREVVLTSGDSNRNSKITVDIPSETTDGTIIEVARGWDRYRAEISVVQDPRFQVLGLDIHLRIPITLKEALDGASFKVPGLKGVHEVTLSAGEAALRSVSVEEAGISSATAKGNLNVRAFIVPPQQYSGTLEAAARSVDSHYDSLDVRANFLANPVAPEFLLEDVGRMTFFLPIRFGEAVEGVEVPLTVRGVNVVLKVPPRWNQQKEIVSSDYSTVLGSLLYVQPEIALPSRTSAELQAAALAIEQHFLSGPRSSLPKKLGSK